MVFSSSEFRVGNPLSAAVKDISTCEATASGTAVHRAGSCRYPSCRMRTEAAIILKTRAFSYLGILKHIRERGFQLRRSQCDTAVMPQKDIFAGRRRGVPARIVHVIQADAAFEREIPPPMQHPRVAPRWHLRRQPSRCSVCSGSRRDTVRGRSARPKEADVRLEAPAAHTHDGSQHFGSQTFGRDRVPVCRRFDRPFFRYGHIHTGIDGSVASPSALTRTAVY